MFTVWDPPGHVEVLHRRAGGAFAVMSGRRSVVKGCFEAVVNVSSAVMSTASHEGSSVNSFLPMPIRGELSFPQGFPC
jgi:hypothetical protein